MKDIAIVIPCYNRTYTLRTLLDSLLKAAYSAPVELIFSIDYSGSNDVSDMAEAFSWPFGPKTIIRHKENIGLRRNIISCGDLSEKHDAVIVLEDDLVVSPLFFEYASRACDFYWDDNRIAGISLYSYKFTESMREFVPITNGFDTYFMQWTSSWGQLWTKNQWSDFKHWYKEHNEDLFDFPIPQYVKEWEQSWKKYNIAYITDQNKFYVYPTVSYTTMVPTAGVHWPEEYFNIPFRVPLAEGFPRDYVFQNLDSAITYDCFFELNNYYMEVGEKKASICFNIYCEKSQSNLKGDYYVTSKLNHTIEPVKSWGRNQWPLEMNIIKNLSGSGLYMYNTRDFKREELPLEAKRELKYYLSNKQLLWMSIKKRFGLQRVMGT